MNKKNIQKQNKNKEKSKKKIGAIKQNEKPHQNTIEI